LPSQKQLKWSQLRVGLTVIFASMTLALLLFLMSGTRRLVLQAHHAEVVLRQRGAVAAGRAGAAQRRGYRQCQFDCYCSRQRQAGHSRRSHHEGEHQIRLQPAPRFEVTSLDTAGVLGETYLDIDSSQAIGPPAQDGDTLPTQSIPTSTRSCAPARARCRTWTRCSSAPTAFWPSRKAARDRWAN
jgi:phospholipid/cholesterol/gamma-HCH transport system substrate-binding protein